MSARHRWTVHAGLLTVAAAIIAIVPIPPAQAGSVTFVHRASGATSEVPSIERFAPRSGPYHTFVRIRGLHFSGANSVTFAGVPGRFRVVSDRVITAFVPRRASTGPIAVTTRAGSTETSAAFAMPPLLTGFSPVSGKVGTRVVLSGNGLVQIARVAFNGVPARFKMVTDHRIVARVARGASTGPITITTAGGSTVGPADFTVT